MLELLHQRLRAAYDAGELRLRLAFNDVTAMADDIGVSSEAEAVQMFVRLGQEGYYSSTGLDKPVNVGLGQRLPFALVHIDRLTTRGLLEIGQLPNPAERMLQSLEAIELAITARADLQPKEKQEARQALEELKHFLRGLPPGVAVEVGSTFLRGMFGG